jgi:hypothetical protein
MRDYAMIIMLPASMLFGWLWTREAPPKEVVVTPDDCIVQKRDQWRASNRYPGLDEWRNFRDQCWSEMGASVNDAADLN